MAKYKVSLTDLDTRGGIEKLEGDRIPRHEIFKALFDKTDGINTDERRKLVSNLYCREYKNR